MIALQERAAQPDTTLQERWRSLGYLTDERVGWALERAGTQWPDRVALVDGSGRYTFAELARRARRFARGMLEAGISAGDVVTWALPNGVEAVLTAAAIWRIGAVSNPVVTIYRQREFSFIVDQLRPDALVSVSDYRGRSFTAELDEACERAGHEPGLRLDVHGDSSGWKPVDDLLSAPPELPRDVEPAPPDEPCLVLYTSGTTSDPKGVMHSSRTLGHEVRSMQREWALTWRDVMFMASPLTHIAGLLQGLMVPAAVGARSVLMDRWDPARAVDLIEREGATYMAGATPFLQGIVEEYQKRDIAAPALRQFCCGGASVPPHLVEAAEDLGFTAYRCWGMTEFPTTTLASENDELERRARTDGHIAEGLEIETVDEERLRLPVGEAGELRVRGPERMLGYVDPQLNGEVIDAEGWFYTGDVGVIDSEGYVTITGRKKDIINRGGEKFSARELEDLLSEHPDVSEVAVLGVPGGRLGERVCAAIVPREGARPDAASLSEYLRGHDLARQKIPEEFQFRDELPRTASGKIQKFKLVESWNE